MAKKRKFSLVILITVIFLGMPIDTLNAKTPGQAEITTNQYTQPDEINTDWQNYQDIPESFVQLAENENFILYANEESLAIKVFDKRSGYVWHSNLDQKEEEDRLNKTWTAFAQSGISIDYLDLKAISERASITNAEHTIDMKITEQGFEAEVTFLAPSITLMLRVTLEAEGVSVEIPFDSIKQENEEFKLGIVYVYPFFGYTRYDNVPGYMFIPDGSGSLIRFSESTKAKNMFYGRYYGADLGMLTSLPYDPTINRPFKLSIPVFGMIHGYKQNGFIAVVEQGASYGELQVHPAGIITNFNFLYNIFVYNESYYQATNRSGAGVTTIQRQTNQFNVKMHYRFLTGDDSDYVGMAKSYQQYLLDKNELNKILDENTSIGIKLEFLGGEKEKVLFWNRLIPMTTVEQMKQILEDLEARNVDVVYYGWQPLGASTMPPKKLKLDNDLGNKEALRSLVDDINSGGGKLYLYFDPQAALIDEKGYSPRYDLAMSITNSNIRGYNRNKVNYYLNFNATKDLYESLSKDLFSEFEAGLALDNIGSTLYSDFKGDSVVNREEMIANYQALFFEAIGDTAFYRPNDYLYSFMSAYYDMPITTSGYLYTTDTVPFLEIVLAGYVPYYGTAMNFSSDLEADLLRHADFGVYPTFFLTHEVTAKILNTKSSWIYTSSISQWKQDLEQSYQWLNELLAPVKGQTIVARDVIAQGVVATSYENGKQIIVNYTTKPYEVAGVAIEGKDALVLEVNP
ncbi:MAG: hypothetical protein XD73_0472 [Anaerolinea thermophila]|uniref:Uncharacterized protein n=1 Tax=Anaerolinea thermophila TaxID=167964 RepID=A0A101FYB2_9CHLR|nr:MAG: hypothetical protein XD73_0472 [Anaerolinea thermophila]